MRHAVRPASYQRFQQQPERVDIRDFILILIYGGDPHTLVGNPLRQSVGDQPLQGFAYRGMAYSELPGERFLT